MTHRYRSKGGVTIATALPRGSNFTLALLISALVLLADPGESGASVIAWSGHLEFESPPPLVAPGQVKATPIHVFHGADQSKFSRRASGRHHARLELPSELRRLCDLTPSTLSAGTAVDSYFMYSQPVGQPHNDYPYTATITFNAPILGLIVTTSTLNATNASVGAPGTTYDTTGDAGLESDDKVELVGAGTIHVEFSTSVDTDDIRIITAAGPSTGPGGPNGGGAGGYGPGGLGGSGYSPGYTELASDGGIFNFGTQFFGSMGGQRQRTHGRRGTGQRAAGILDRGV